MAEETTPALATWSWEKQADVRAPIVVALSVETEEGLRLDIEMTEHQAAHLLSGTVTKVEAKVRQYEKEN